MCAQSESAKVKRKDEEPHDGPSTIARGILSTSTFIWLPPCQPHQSRSNSEVADAYLKAAMQCPRWHIRRNALCDHMRLLLPQKTRERLEKDIAERKPLVEFSHVTPCTTITWPVGCHVITVVSPNARRA